MCVILQGEIDCFRITQRPGQQWRHACVNQRRQSNEEARNSTESQTNLSKATSAVLKFKYGAILRLRVLKLSIAHFKCSLKFPVVPYLSDLTWYLAAYLKLSSQQSAIIWRMEVRTKWPLSPNKISSTQFSSIFLLFFFFCCCGALTSAASGGSSPADSRRQGNRQVGWPKKKKKTEIRSTCDARVNETVPMLSQQREKPFNF